MVKLPKPKKIWTQIDGRADLPEIICIECADREELSLLVKALRAIAYGSADLCVELPLEECTCVLPEDNCWVCDLYHELTGGGKGGGE